MKLRLVLVALLSLFLLAGKVIDVPQYILQEQFDNLKIYNVLDYGAVADAAEATGCAAGEDVPMNCTPGTSTGTDDSAAIQAAVDAACAAGGGAVFAPAGSYRIGSPVFVTCDNITLYGDGASTVFMAGGTTGFPLISVCQLDGAACDLTPSDRPNNVHVRDIAFADDDPWAHGASLSKQLHVTGISGTFVYDEELTFDVDNPPDSIYFYWQSATTGAGELIYRANTSSCSGACSGTITGSRSGTTAVYDSTTHVVGASDSKAILMSADDSSITNVRVDHMGKDGIEIFHGSTNVTVSGNTLINMPATPSKGSAIAVENGGAAVRVVNNYIQLGNSGNCKGIKIRSTTADITDLIIRGNTFDEDDIGASDHSECEWPIILTATVYDIARTLIESNTINFDVDPVGTCSTTSATTCDEHTDCPAGEWCTNFTGDNGRGGNAIDSGDSSGGFIDGITIAHNAITGNIDADSTGVGSPIAILDNDIRGTHGFGVQVTSDVIRVAGNTISGFSGAPVNASGDDVSIIGNAISDAGADMTSGSLITLGTVPTVVNITNNFIRGVTALPGAVIRGIDCRTVEKSTVIGNTIEDTDYDAILACRTVIGNTIVNSGATGIRMNSGDTGGIISGNRISASTSNGIYLNGVEGVQVTGNHCFDIASNVCISEAGAADNNAVVGNTSLDTGGGAAATITCTGASSLCRDNIVGGAPTSDLPPDCETMYAPIATIAATDDLVSVWKADNARGMTITRIWCETDVGTVTMNLQKDDGGVTDMATADLVCATTPVSTTTFVSGENVLAAGERVDWDIVSVATAPTQLTVCIERVQR